MKVSSASSLPKVINLLSDLVVFSHYDFNQFLKNLIKVITEIISVDSCFIYFFDRDKKILILVGSKKPHQGEIGNIILKEGEGITGWTAEHKKTVVLERKAYLDPRFKPLRELPEDLYESFLSVPIIDNTGMVGVINLQNRNPYKFSKLQIETIESLVKIISSAFVKIALERKVGSLEDKLEERKIVEKAKGVLMRLKDVSEDAAYNIIRKESMNQRKSMKETAQTIISVLGGVSPK